MEQANIKHEKERLRRVALKLRDAIEPTHAIENALALAEHVAELDVQPDDVVAAYWPIRSEIDPRPLMSALQSEGIRLALPIVLDWGMAFRRLLRTGDLVDAGFGTMAPGPEAEKATPSVILLPLAAYDGSGTRLGYGQGHYDRAIAALRGDGLSPRLIGLAHSAQQLDAIPSEPHDVRLGAVLCERGLRPSSGA